MKVIAREGKMLIRMATRELKVETESAKRTAQENCWETWRKAENKR